jgi:hypothetical protein
LQKSGGAATASGNNYVTIEIGEDVGVSLSFDFKAEISLVLKLYIASLKPNHNSHGNNYQTFHSSKHNDCTTT